MKRWTCLALAGLLLWLAGGMLPRLAQERVDKRLTVRERLEGAPPAYALADGLLGGFRSFLISSLWMRAQDKKQAGQFYEMVDIYKIISTLEPNYPSTWANMAWDLSYNVAAEFNEDPRERLYWHIMGVNMLRNEAIRHNPRAARLYYELSWIFYNKATESVDPAFPLYRQYIATQMMRILLGPGERGELEKIVAAAKEYPDPKVFLDQPEVKALKQKLAEKKFDLLRDSIYLTAVMPAEVKELLEQKENKPILEKARYLEAGRELAGVPNMRPEVMLELNRRFGEIDWRLPQALALYWGWLGQEYHLAENPGSNDLRYERMIYFSLIQLAHKGTGLMWDNPNTPGEVSMIAPPNTAMLDKTIEYMEELIAKHKDDPGTIGVRAGFENFLRICVFNYYFFDDDRINAERIRQKLLKVTGDEKRFGGTLNDFLRKELPDFVEGMMPDRGMMLLGAYCNRVFQYLASGDLAKFREQQQLFDSLYLKLYQDWKTRFEGTFYWQQQTGMPTPEVMQAQYAVNILSGNAGYSPEMLKKFEAGLKAVMPRIWQLVNDDMKNRNRSVITPLAPENRQEQPTPPAPAPSAPAIGS